MPIVIKDLQSSDIVGSPGIYTSLIDKINDNFDQIVINGGGPIGHTGNTGNAGVQGPKGQRGNHWFSGSSQPVEDYDGSDLTEGDYFLYETGEVFYYETNSGWAQSGINLKGATGVTGATGQNGSIGGLNMYLGQTATAVGITLGLGTAYKTSLTTGFGGTDPNFLFLENRLDSIFLGDKNWFNQYLQNFTTVYNEDLSRWEGFSLAERDSIPKLTLIQDRIDNYSNNLLSFGAYGLSKLRENFYSDKIIDYSSGGSAITDFSDFVNLGFTTERATSDETINTNKTKFKIHSPKTNIYLKAGGIKPGETAADINIQAKNIILNTYGTGGKIQLRGDITFDSESLQTKSIILGYEDSLLLVGGTSGEPNFGGDVGEFTYAYLTNFSTSEKNALFVETKNAQPGIIVFAQGYSNKNAIEIISENGGCGLFISALSGSTAIQVNDGNSEFQFIKSGNIEASGITAGSINSTSASIITSNVTDYKIKTSGSSYATFASYSGYNSGGSVLLIAPDWTQGGNISTQFERIKIGTNPNQITETGNLLNIGTLYTSVLRPYNGATISLIGNISSTGNIVTTGNITGNVAGFNTLNINSLGVTSLTTDNLEVDYRTINRFVVNRADDIILLDPYSNSNYDDSLTYGDGLAGLEITSSYQVIPLGFTATGASATISPKLKLNVMQLNNTPWQTESAGILTPVGSKLILHFRIWNTNPVIDLRELRFGWHEIEIYYDYPHTDARPRKLTYGSDKAPTIITLQAETDPPATQYRPFEILLELYFTFDNQVIFNYIGNNLGPNY